MILGRCFENEEQTNGIYWNAMNSVEKRNWTKFGIINEELKNSQWEL